MKSARAGLMVLFLSLTGPASALAATEASVTVPEEVSKQISDFFAIVKSGQNEAAIKAITGSSPLWERSGIKEQMTAQLDTATKIYGPMTEYECPVTYRTGTLFLRQYCFAQHQELILRWQFDFVRAGRGWSLSAFSFADQSTQWPDQP